MARRDGSLGRLARPLLVSGSAADPGRELGVRRPSLRVVGELRRRDSATVPSSAARRDTVRREGMARGPARGSTGGCGGVMTREVLALVGSSETSSNSGTSAKGSSATLSGVLGDVLWAGGGVLKDATLCFISWRRASFSCAAQSRVFRYGEGGGSGLFRGDRGSGRE